jgi:predicted GIY-YIG superfamily endonuclease
MPWTGNNLSWDPFTIYVQAPAASGIYVLRRGDVWIYLGETDDIQHRLLEHYNGHDLCVKEQGPTSFGFELLPARTRVPRLEELIRELSPVCNRGRP